MFRVIRELLNYIENSRILASFSRILKLPEALTSRILNWDPEVPFSYMFRVIRELLNYIGILEILDYFTEF